MSVVDPGSRKAAARAALAIAPGVLLANFAGGIAFPILPIVGVRAHLPLAFIGVILAANRATRVVASPIVGSFVDRVGGRPMLLVGLLLQVVVMIFYVLGVRTGHPGIFFLLGRLLHGPGSACVFVAGQALALHAGGRAHGGRAAGSVRAALALGVPLGLVGGGIFSDLWGESVAFEISIGALVIATILAFALVPDLRVQRGPRPRFVDTLAALSDRRLSAVGALNFACSFSASGMVLTTIVLLVSQRGVSVLGFGEKGTAGALMGLMVLTEALFMPFAGRAGDRWRAHAAIALGGLMALVPALAVLALAHRAGVLCGALVLLGLAAGALGPSLLAMVGQWVDVERRGVGVGLLQLCGDAGGTLGPMVGTALLAGSVTTAYLVSAAFVACFLPAGIWLAMKGRA